MKEVFVGTATDSSNQLLYLQNLLSLAVAIVKDKLASLRYGDQHFIQRAACKNLFIWPQLFL